jgi:hypothetical protein
LYDDMPPDGAPRLNPVGGKSSRSPPGAHPAPAIELPP